jgi:Phage integrase, N-terminal SAM-like domain
VPQLLEPVRNRTHVKHYSLRTEAAHFRWIKEYITFQKKRHPAGMGHPEDGPFLTHLAVNRNAAAYAMPF